MSNSWGYWRRLQQRTPQFVWGLDDGTHFAVWSNSRGAVSSTIPVTITMGIPEISVQTSRQQEGFAQVFCC